MRDRIETFGAATLGAIIFVTVVWLVFWGLFSFTTWRLWDLPKPEAVRFAMGLCAMFGGWMTVCHDEND